jgi:hypothetical protein
MTDNPLPATPETLQLPKCPEERKNPPPRKEQYFTFEQVRQRAHKNAAWIAGCEAAWLPIYVTANTSPGESLRTDGSGE